jgi:alkylmercury lyase-like protein
MPKQDRSSSDFDSKLRLSVYRHTIRTGRVPTVAEIARALSSPARKTRDALTRLSESHAFMLQEDGELWRVAPFSAISTAFPVQVGKRSYWGNCTWDALGIPAMLKQDARIDAACSCCNYEMKLDVKKGKLLRDDGVIHIAVPARDWYKDVVFT